MWLYVVSVLFFDVLGGVCKKRQGLIVEKKKRKAGQPTKFTEEVQRLLKKLAAKNLTYEEMAEIVGVDPATIWNWKAKYLKFFEIIKQIKYDADNAVERCLRERAMGYSCPEDKVFNDNGKPLIVPTRKQYPPDTAAAIFWLKNRDPDRWRDKQQVEHSLDAPMINAILGNLPPDQQEATKQALLELTKKA